ncbi:MAG: transketolase, partial [Candidatus Jacksonbacteria bacterium]
RAKSAHIGSNFSIADILTVLYNNALKIDSKRPQWPLRDRLILSKGHAGACLYAILAEKGFFPKSWLDKFYLPGGLLPGHATHTVPGVEVSTGALGHGLPIACGMALSAKLDRKKWRVFCLLSDGELDEGSVWEALLFAPHHKLDNLTLIIDYNKIQALGNTNEVLNLEPLTDKLRAFNWAATEIDGHNFDEIKHALRSVPLKKGSPSCIIAHTVKGKGVSFMENKLEWHYKTPSDEEFEEATREIKMQKQ